MTKDLPFKSEQEQFWAGEFGRDYISRNQGDDMVASNLDLFSKALRTRARFSLASNSVQTSGSTCAP